jgi:VWFA-related protein
MRRLFKLSMGLMLLTFLGALADGRLRGQSVPGTTSPKPVATPQQETTHLEATSQEATQQEKVQPPVAQQKLRVRTNEVTVPVTVVDKQGEVVLDLVQKDFHVLDDGVEQPIDHVELGGDPLAVALVVETSSRIKMMAPVIHDMGSIFTEAVMAFNGEAAVISYDSTVEIRQAFTEDHDAVQKAVENLEFDAPEAALYDGMATAVQLLRARPKNHRRIMLVVGESQDWSSSAKLGLVLREAEHEDITIYAIGPSTTSADLRGGTKGLGNGMQLPPFQLGKSPPISTQRPHDDPLGRPYYDWITPAMWLLTRGLNEIKNHQLEVAATATGGTHYRVFRDRTIRTVLDDVGGELHAQYTLTYKMPGDDPKDGQMNGESDFHRIAVTVSRDNLIVRARLGYFASTPLN